jgi:Dyp-type peroxidase family
MSNASPAPGFDINSIQGNILAPFAKDHQAFLLMRLPDELSHGRAWIAEMADEVASHAEVKVFNDLFKLVYSRHTEKHGVVEATWTQVLLSGHGLQKLGTPDAELRAVSASLADGMKAHAAQLGDQNESDPNNWTAPLGEADLHAVVVVAADDADDLHRQVDHMASVARRHGVQILATLRGATLEGSLRGHEHFGFKDGISQPSVDDPTALNRFLLGSAASGPTPWGAPSGLPAWATGASLAALRVLHQDVAAFRSWVAAQAAPTGLSPGQLEAKLMGRWPSGAPLAETDSDDPAIAVDSTRNNAFDYADDPDGLKTPRFAHIRKANPRAENPGPTGGAAESEQRRLLRRGIPFGRALPQDATTDDGRDRGLIFLGFMASIEGQFEFIQESWCNNQNFPVGPTAAPGSNYNPQPSDPADGPDPIIGQHHGQGHDNLRLSSGFHDLALQQFVTTRGGEYLISLSIPTLVALGSQR